MMAQETVRGFKGLQLKHVEGPDAEIVDLLGHSIVGTEGGLRYSVRDIGERMGYYGKGLSFIALYKKESLTGVIGLCRRKTISSGIEYNSTFLRYLSFNKSFQIARVKRRERKRMSRIEDSFKLQIFSMFSNALRELHMKENPSEPHIAYAVIESENERSRNFAYQAGYEYIRSIQTIVFNRFNPVASPDARKLNPQERPMMAELLADQYKDYSFYTGEFAFMTDSYYVMSKENEIVAGISVIPTVFTIQKIPGFIGWIMLNVLPVTPYLKKLIQSGEFRFLVVDSIYCRKGSEHLLPDLFESACASEGHYSALTWLDDQSELYKSISLSRRMGMLNRLLKTESGLVYASFSNIG
ncbi:MAG: hypothetical protein E4H16_05295, partial [Candidatus Atribacteria bacterium]